jgi:hypothetical protein
MENALPLGVTSRPGEGNGLRHSLRDGHESLEETDRGQFLCGGYFKEHLVGQDKTTDRCVVVLALDNSQLERVERAKTTAKPVASYQVFCKRIMCVGHRKDFEDSKGEVGEQLNPERQGRRF